MKKRIIILWIISFVLLFITTSCDECEHEIVSTVVHPTCDTGGYTVHKCKLCDYEYYTNLTSAKGHDFKIIEKEEATCTDDGHKAYYECTECGYIKDYEVIPVLGHDYQVSWTWSDDFSKAFVSLDCQNDDSHNVNLPATITKEVVTPASCDSYGLVKYVAKATYENIEYTDIKEERLDYVNHNLKSTVVLPNCEESGYTIYECTECGYSYKANYTDPLGHDYNMRFVWNGYDSCDFVLTCKRDPSHTMVIEATITSHIENEGVCGVNTIIEYTATASYNDVLYQDIKKELIPSPNHIYDKTEVKPTCTEGGYTIYTCQCGDTYKSDYTDPTGHDYVGVETKPTCTEKGYTTYTCSVCGDSYISDYTEELGHNYETLVVKPTCEEKGYNLHTCTECGDTYSDCYVEELGHSYVGVATRPTCEDLGFTTYTCKDCGHSYVDNYVDQLGHNYTDLVVPPTCTDDGYTKHICSVCDHSYIDCYVEKLGHKYISEVVNPTCCDEGYTTYTCKECGDTYKSDYKDPLGHDYEVKFIWDDTSCVVNLICKNDSSHVVTDEPEVIKEVVIEPTCYRSGQYKYDASYTYNNILYTDTKLVTVTIDDHVLEYGICKYCNHIEPSYFNNTYGYNSLFNEPNGESLVSFYEEIDEAILYYYENYDVDLPTNLKLANIYYNKYNMTYKEAQYVWQMYKLDHPLYYWFGNSYNFSNTYLALKCFEEFVDAQERKHYDTLFVNYIKDFVKNINHDDSIYMKTLYITDLICNSVDYKYDSTGNPDSSGHAHSITGILNETGVVCEGYSMMFNLLLNTLGIDNIYVVGDSHAYNMVMLDDGNWYWYDLTWMDKPEWELGIRYHYFCLNDEQIITSLGYNWSSSSSSFMSTHTPYPHVLQQNGSYLLPERSNIIYDSNEPMIYEEFMVSGLTFSVAGYNKVMLCASNLTGEVVIPENVTYMDRTYEVVGIISTDGKNRIVGPTFAEGTTKVYIPSSVKFIADEVFDVSTLEYIEVSDDSIYFEDVSGVLYTKALATIIKYPSNYQEEEYYIADGTIDIAYNAFNDMNKLKTIYIPASISNIGTYNYGYGYRYSDTGNIRMIIYELPVLALMYDLVIDSNNTTYIEINDIIYNYKKTVVYANDSSNEDAILVLEDTTVGISNYAFYYTTAQAIVMPISVSYFSKYAFLNTTLKIGILYEGTLETFEKIQKDSTCNVENLTIYYYSDIIQTGHFWTYNEENDYIIG